MALWMVAAKHNGHTEAYRKEISALPKLFLPRLYGHPKIARCDLFNGLLGWAKTVFGIDPAQNHKKTIAKTRKSYVHNSGSSLRNAGHVYLKQIWSIQGAAKKQMPIRITTKSSHSHFQLNFILTNTQSTNSANADK